MPNLEARHAARMLVRHIGIFGCPSQIVSDRGTHLTADIIQELMVLVATNHVLTLAASKQENTAVENANKRSQEYLCSMLFDNRILKRWYDVLPLVQRIEPNDVIGVSIVQLLFGNSTVESFFLIFPRREWRRRLPCQIGPIRCLKRSGCSLIRHNGYISKEARHMEATTGVITRFDVGSYVLISYNPQKMNAKPPTKWHPRLKGPNLVANVQGDKYSCQNLVTDEIEGYHVTKLREFRYDDERYVDPRDIALRDRDEFYVEKILAHHGDVGRLKTLAFHVKWRGFDESFKSWEPWKNLRETEMLHRYLTLHGLQKLILAKFRERYPEKLAVGRRRRRQDVAADEEAQMVSAVGLKSSLWSSETWTGKRLKIQKIYCKITFAEDLESYFQDDL